MRGFFRSEAGATAAYFAILAPVLIGFAALGGEAGLWLVTKSKLQHITDTAALSAATRAISTPNTTLITSAATERAKSSGLRAGDTLNVALPPVTGAHAGMAGFVEVTATRTVRRYLTRIYTQDPMNLSARSVAGVLEGTGDRVCMMALSPSASPAFAVGGAGTVNVTGCAFASNSNATNSFDMIGARVVVTGSCLYAVGGVSASDGLQLTDCLEPQDMERPTPDPYAALRMPTLSEVSGLIPQASTLTGSFTPNANLIEYGVPVALFNGGLTISGTTTLGAGLYIVNGGSLKISANAVLSGTGISFYLMNGATLDITGGAELNVKAYDAANPGLRSDRFAGLLFFGDREGTPVSHSLSGNSDSSMNGVVYFPNDKLSYIGDAGSSYPCMEIIASTLSVSGSGTVTLGCEPDRPSSAPRAMAARTVALLE